MTNLDRIHQMTSEELIIFLKYCNFQSPYPIIEGQRFYTDEELIDWFNSDIFAKNAEQYKNCALCIYYRKGRCRYLKSDFFDKEKKPLEKCDLFIRKSTSWRFN